MRRQPLARGLLLAFSVSVFPLTAAAVPSSTPAVSPTPTAAALTGANAQRLTNLKTRGAAEIDRRQANLNTAIAKLQASTKLTAADRDALLKLIQDEQAGLTALRDKLAAEAALAGARADVASIVTDYRVYALMLPKARLVAAVDRLSIASGRLSDLQVKLQTRVTAVKSNGKDTTAMQAKLDEMKAKLQDAATQTTGLVSKVLAIQPSDYNSNHAVLTSYRATLGVAQADLKTARDNAQAVISALSAF